MNLKNIILHALIILFTASCSPGRHGTPLPPMKASTPTKTRSTKIFVDPGHGGKDDGAKSSSGQQCFEKSLNLTTAMNLERYLKDYGYETVLTRGDDTFVPLRLRSAFANGNRANLFVSVHYNASENPKAEGIEVYYYDSNDSRAAESKKLALLVMNRLGTNTKLKPRGVKHGNLAVIRDAKMPAILVEGGFMTNSTEIEKIKEPEHMRLIAQSIAQGINDYLK